MITIIQDFTLINSIFISMLYLVWLLSSLGLFLNYTFGFSLPMHSIYIIGLAEHLYINWKNTLFCYLSTDCLFVKVWGLLFSSII